MPCVHSETFVQRVAFLACLLYVRREKDARKTLRATGMNMTQAQNNIRKKTGRLFDDLSVAQVAAGALAAVTSMLLASQIGIAGSVIGVAVGSVVATVTSQLYKKFLSVSAEKLQDLRPGSECSDNATAVVADASSDVQSRETVALAQGDPAATRTLNTSASSLSASPLCSRTPRIGDANANVGDKVMLQRAARKRRTVVQRRVVAIAMASALVAVAISAAVISLATTGQGIGGKAVSFVPVDTQSQSADASSSSGSGSASGSAPSTSTPSSDESSSQGSSSASSSDASSTSKDSAAAQDSSSSSSQEGTGGGTGTSNGSSSGSGQEETGSSGSNATTPESGQTETGGSGGSSGTSDGTSGGTSSGTSTGSAAQSATGSSTVARS